MTRNAELTAKNKPFIFSFQSDASLLRELAAIAGGKGGSKPDQARGAAPDREKLEQIKAAATEKF